MTRRRRLTMAVTLAALALALAACGVPTSSGAKALSQGDLPPSPAQTPTTVPQTGLIGVPIVLLDAATNPATAVPELRYTPQQSYRLSAPLRFLLQGPAGLEPAHGLFSAIPPTTKLIGVSPNPVVTSSGAPASLVTVNLSPDFLETSGSNQVLAAEQVVFTVACNLSLTTRVSFQVAGVPQGVPVANGTFVRSPVSAADYGSPPTCPS
ncbi:MAG: GerMN domain-containing protein [Acidimicrobiales bacterium]